MDIDEVYTRTGECGRFQKKAFVANGLASIFSAWQMVQNIFAGAIPAVQRCEPNETDACAANCTLVVFPEDNFTSFATEWNMTCGANITAVQSIQSIFVAGVMVGSFIFGGLGDRFGRFPVLLACQFFCSAFALGSSFANIWIVYAVLRFITGFFLSGQIIVTFVLSSELVGPSMRGLVACVSGICFACGISLLSLSAYVTQDWRINSIVLGSIGLLITPAIYWLMDESPRWYLARGDMEKCQKALQTIATMNGHNLGKFDLKVDYKKDSGEKKSKTNILSLFRNSILRRVTLVQTFIWFTVSAVYYGLTIASGDMGSSKYISVILSSISEIPSNIITLFIMEWPRCGRVRTSTVGLILSGIFCGSIWFIADKHTTVIIGLACAGKFFNVVSFTIIYVQAGELYPTAVRNVGLGVCSVFNRVGGILAPQIVNLNNLYHNGHFIAFGVVGILAGVLGLLLPETLGRPLPSTPDDIYKQVKKIDSNITLLERKSADKQALLSSLDDDEEEDVIL